MGLKKILKGVFLLAFIFFIFTGIYALSKRIMSSDLFTIRSVEIRGVMNADRDKLAALGEKLIGLNVFTNNMEEMLKTDDPWTQKITAVRALPSGINIVVYEEKPLFSYKDIKGKCYVFTGGGKRIKTSCQDVQIHTVKDITDRQAKEFASLLEKNKDIAFSNVILKDYSFIAVIDGDTIYCPYNSDIFDENYLTYKNSIKKLYKTVEYADLTIGKRIFIKGTRNEPSKG